MRFASRSSSLAALALLGRGPARGASRAIPISAAVSPRPAPTATAPTASAVGEVASLAGRPKDELVAQDAGLQGRARARDDHAAARQGLHRRADRRSSPPGSRRRSRRNEEAAMNDATTRFPEGRSAPPALAAIPGCATMGAGAPARWWSSAAATAARRRRKYLRMWSNGAHRRDAGRAEPDFVSCPMSNLVLGGSKTLADLTVSYDGLARRQASRSSATRRPASTRTSASSSSRAAATCRTTASILSPGVDFLWDKVPGARQRRRAGERSCTRGRRDRRPWRCAGSSRRCATAASSRSRFRSRRIAARPDRTSARARSRGTSSARSRESRC